MHPRLEELSALLDGHRATLLDAVAAVPTADRDQRAGADEWTVAEVLDHLRAVEGGVGGLLAKRAQRARESGVGPDPETVSVAGMLDHADLVDTARKLEAPEIVRPRADATCEDALAGLHASREALRDSMRALDGLDGTQVRATHAVLGEIDAYQWLLFIGQHELRHVRQIGEIAARLRVG